MKIIHFNRIVFFTVFAVSTIINQSFCQKHATLTEDPNKINNNYLFYNSIDTNRELINIVLYPLNKKYSDVAFILSKEKGEDDFSPYTVRFFTVKGQDAKEIFRTKLPKYNFYQEKYEIINSSITLVSLGAQFGGSGMTSRIYAINPSADNYEDKFKLVFDYDNGSIKIEGDLLYTFLPIWAKDEAHFDHHKVKVVISKFTSDGNVIVKKEAYSRFKYDIFSSDVNALFNTIKLKEPELVKSNSELPACICPENFRQPSNRDFYGTATKYRAKDGRVYFECTIYLKSGNFKNIKSITYSSKSKLGHVYPREYFLGNVFEYGMNSKISKKYPYTVKFKGCNEDEVFSIKPEYDCCPGASGQLISVPTVRLFDLTIK